MLKYHKLISFCFGLLFSVVLQMFATPEPIFRFLAPAFLIYAGLVLVYNRWYLKQIAKYNFWILLRPLLLLGAGFGLFLVMPSAISRGIFLASTALVITFFEIMLGNLAENLLLNETLIIAFGLFFSFAGFYQYVPTYGFFYLAGVFASSCLLTRSFYEFVPQPQNTKLVGSLAVGLFCAEFFWSLNFLPLHFSILGFLLFNLFYFCIILNYYHLFHILNFKKIQFHLFLILVSTITVLAVTPWEILE